MKRLLLEATAGLMLSSAAHANKCDDIPLTMSALETANKATNPAGVRLEVLDATDFRDNPTFGDPEPYRGSYLNYDRYMSAVMEDRTHRCVASIMTNMGMGRLYYGDIIFNNHFYVEVQFVPFTR